MTKADEVVALCARACFSREAVILLGDCASFVHDGVCLAEYESRTHSKRGYRRVTRPIVLAAALAAKAVGDNSDGALKAAYDSTFKALTE